MPYNNGIKKYTLLVQYSILTNLPTGIVKPNVMGDPDYVAPENDFITCPLPGPPEMMDIELIIDDGFVKNKLINYFKNVIC